MSDFEAFWQKYPRKVGKLAAEREWRRLQPPIADVLAALEWQKVGWIDVKYTPHPRTWLCQGRWQDEAGELVLTEAQRRAFGPSAEWVCPHVEPCNAPGPCHTMTKLGRPVRVGVTS